MRPHSRLTKVLMFKLFVLLFVILALLKFDLYISSRTHCTFDVYFLDFRCTVKRDDYIPQPKEEL